MAMHGPTSNNTGLIIIVSVVTTMAADDILDTVVGDYEHAGHIVLYDLVRLPHMHKQSRFKRPERLLGTKQTALRGVLCTI
jgi:hypothetical protein